MNLDLELADKSMILQTCLQQQLFRSLINICVSTKDFITPMVKLSSLITLKPILTPEEQKTGRTILAYIKNCLDGYYIDYHDDEKYLDMLEKLIAYFVLPISLKLISKTDPENFFKLLELFFEGRVFQLILENSDRFVIKNNSYMVNNIFESTFHLIQSKAVPSSRSTIEYSRTSYSLTTSSWNPILISYNWKSSFSS